MRHYVPNSEYWSEYHEPLDALMRGRVPDPDLYVRVTVVSDRMPVGTSGFVDQANGPRLIWLRIRDPRDRFQRHVLQSLFPQPTLMALGWTFSNHVVSLSARLRQS